MRADYFSTKRASSIGCGKMATYVFDAREERARRTDLYMTPHPVRGRIDFCEYRNGQFSVTKEQDHSGERATIDRCPEAFALHHARHAPEAVYVNLNHLRRGLAKVVFR